MRFVYVGAGRERDGDSGGDVEGVGEEGDVGDDYRALIERLGEGEDHLVGAHVHVEGDEARADAIGRVVFLVCV